MQRKIVRTNRTLCALICLLLLADRYLSTYLLATICHQLQFTYIYVCIFNKYVEMFSDTYSVLYGCTEAMRPK